MSGPLKTYNGPIQHGEPLFKDHGYLRADPVFNKAMGEAMAARGRLDSLRGILRRAGKRVDEAAAAMARWQAENPGPLDESHEQSFGAVETELELARREYRRAVEAITGQDAAAVERSLAA